MIGFERKEMRMQSKEYQKLRECPFCGGNAVVISAPLSGVWLIQCKTCTAMIGRKTKVISTIHGKEYFETSEAAEIAWNRRADDGA